MTNKRLWFIICNIAFVTIAVFVSTYVIYVLLYLLQLKLDTLSDTISLLGGILNLTVVQFLQFVSNAWLSVLLINFLYTQLNVLAETTTKVAFDKETKRNKLVTIGMVRRTIHHFWRLYNFQRCLLNRAIRIKTFDYFASRGHQ